MQKFDSVLDGFVERSPRPLLHGALWVDGQTREFARGAMPPAGTPVFEIGSIGKTFTTTLLALMVRDREVALDDPVARFRPELPFAARVTLRQLASHTSGLPTNPAGIWTMLVRGRAFAESFRPRDLDRFLAGLPRQPRRAGRFRYSNVGMALLGGILGRCSGSGYGAAVTERILEPLGMHDTRLDWRDYAPERVVPGHDARGRAVPPFAWEGMEPAGLWRSTVADMLLFLRAQRGQFGSLWPELARLTTAPVSRIDSRTRIGLGWFLSEIPGIGTVASHEGGTFGQTAIAGWALERDLALVILTNRKPPAWHFLRGACNLEGLAARLLATLT